MGGRVYRFEKLKEVGRNGANAIYDVRDPADSSTLQLYEWTVSPGEVGSVTETLVELRRRLKSGEAFADGNRFYVAVSKPQAGKNLEILRAHQLFPGVWPGIFESIELAKTAKATNFVKAKEAESMVHAPVVVEPASRWPAIVVLLLLVGLATVIGWWRSREAVQPVPIQPKAILESEPPRPIVPVTPELVKITRFSVEPRLGPSGQTWMVNWEVAHAKSVVIKGLRADPQIVDSSGAKNYTLPVKTDELILEATGERDGDVASETRPIRYVAPQIEFHGVPEQVAVGDPFTLRWKVLGAERVRIDRPGHDALPHDGEEQIQTTGSREYIMSYTLTAEGPDGKISTAQTTERIVPRIVDFSTKRIPIPAGQCEIWLVRWTVNGASGVSVNSVQFAASGYIVAHRVGRYSLEASNRGGTVRDVQSVSVSPGARLCEGR